MSALLSLAVSGEDDATFGVDVSVPSASTSLSPDEKRVLLGALSVGELVWGYSLLAAHPFIGGIMLLDGIGGVVFNVAADKSFYSKI